MNHILTTLEARRRSTWTARIARAAAPIFLAAILAPAALAQGFDDEEDCELGWIDLKPAAIIKACTAVIQKGKPNAETWGSRGEAYLETGQYDLAIPDFDRALQLNPRDSFSLMSRAFA